MKVTEPMNVKLSFQIRLYHSKILSGIPDPQVHIIRNPISSMRRPTEMQHLRGNYGGSRIRMDKSNLNLTTIDHSVVKSALISDIIDTIIETRPRGEKVNIVMKMDIEGHECRAILGSEESFLDNDSYFIPSIVMEWRFGSGAGEFRDVCRRVYLLRMSKVLRESGFEPYRISEGMFQRLEDNFTRWPVMDLVWIHQAVASDLLQLLMNDSS